MKLIRVSRRSTSYAHTPDCISLRRLCKDRRGRHTPIEAPFEPRSGQGLAVRMALCVRRSAALRHRCRGTATTTSDASRGATDGFVDHARQPILGIRRARTGAFDATHAKVARERVQPMDFARIAHSFTPGIRCNLLWQRTCATADNVRCDVHALQSRQPGLRGTRYAALDALGPLASPLRAHAPKATTAPNATATPFL